MAGVFESIQIKGLSISNRLVRSATWEGMCEQDGRPTPKLIDWYEQLARGGVGLIITGYTYVRPEGKQLPGKMGLYSNAFEREYRTLVDRVHDAGGKMVMQLVHAGGQTEEKNSGFPALAPSGIKVKQFPNLPRAMTSKDIKEVIGAFGVAAQRAKAYGFDGVQIHGAHGYLVNQFLSPLANQRTDEYGGSMENRARFLFEVYDEIREQVGHDYPVMIKLNAADHLDGGLELEDACFASSRLWEKGIDAIEVSSGTGASGKLGPVRTKILSPDKEAYNLELAMAVKERVGCPVMVVGGFRSLEQVETAIEEKSLDFVCLSRPLIREPDLPNRWAEGDTYPADCISCNKCFQPGMFKGGIYCVPLKAGEKGEGKD